MRFLSLFSGIEAASSAWTPLGWECVGVCEIEPTPCQILQYRHPHALNLGDITTVTEDQIKALGHLDLIVFGSPCQDLSVAGKQKGFTHEDGSTTRSGLFFAAMRVIGWARKHCGLRFAVWENVLGAFSSNAGADFAAVVGQLAGLDTAVPPKGWGNEGCALGTEAMVEWSSLDAQWFGVAQRRRRVFAVADFGNWAGRPPILLEPQGMRGDLAPRRGPGEEVAGTLAARTDGGGFPGSDEAMSGYVQPVGLQRPVLAFGGNNTTGPIDVSTGLRAKGGTGHNDFESETFVLQDVVSTLDASYARLQGCSGQDARHGHSHLIPVAYDTTQITSKTNRSNPQPGDPCHPLAAGAHAPLITYDTIGFNARQDPDSWADRVGPLDTFSGTQAVCITGAVTHTLKAEGFDASEDGTGRGQPMVNEGMRVRRLTPLECERLQGFPDNYTLIPVKRAKKQSKGYRYTYINGDLWQLTADGPRYKALGNSMAVPVMAWIGRQIEYAMLFDAPVPAPGPCAKQTVTATIVDLSGLRHVGTNYCLNPQTTCPRGDMPTGVGYHLCKEICQQVGHAEPVAIAAAGAAARGATLYLEGHTYACDSCKGVAHAAGIVEIVVGKPPDDSTDLFV